MQANGLAVPPTPASPGEKSPIYFAAELAPTANAPPEAPLCYKFMVAGPEEQLRKLKAKYPNLYDDKILANKDGSKTLQAKRQDATGKVITYFYSTSPSACNSYQQNRLDSQYPAGMAGGSGAASPPRGATEAAASASPNQLYRFLGDDKGIVEDTSSKLQWQRCSLGQTWKGMTCAGKAQTYTWDEAQRLGSNGWRLPTKEELASLLYCSTGQPTYWLASRYTTFTCKGNFRRPMIVGDAFPNTPDGRFWSSSPYPDDYKLAWSVFFEYGLVGYDYKSYARYVRLVRGGQ
jgi:hypothetical protein